MNRIITSARSFFSNRTTNTVFAGLAVGIVAAAGMLFNAPTVSADCTPKDAAPETNIIYCGLSGSNASEMSQQLLNYYNSGTDGRERDITIIAKAAYKKTNNHDIDVNNNPLNSGTWQLGTSYTDGTIKVGNTVVGTGVWISSRCYQYTGGHCQPPERYPTLIGDVKINDATWSLGGDSTPKQTLIHFDNNGTADFALWTQCGNMLVFVPVPPAPKSLECTGLSAIADATNPLKYTFTINAKAQNVAITSYSIRYGTYSAGPTPEVGIPDVQTFSYGTSPFQTTHTYQQDDLQQGLLVMAVVNSAQLPTVGISGNGFVDSPQICTYNITPSLVCQALIDNVAIGADAYTFSFTVKASSAAANTDFTLSRNGTLYTSAQSDSGSYKFEDFTVARTNSEQKITVAGFVNTSTSAACSKTYIILPKGQIACQALVATIVDADATNPKYSYKASVITSDQSAPINYTFTFNDGTTSVTESNTTGVASHKYLNLDSSKQHTFTTSFKATQGDAAATDAISACLTSVTTPRKPQVLSKTGPEGVGLLAGSTTVLGTAARYIALRRKARL